VTQSNGLQRKRHEHSKRLQPCSSGGIGLYQTIPKIPTLIVHLHCCDFIGPERHLRVTTNDDDAAFTDNDLVKTPAVFEVHRDDLIIDAVTLP
jgi:hypothetical protein